MKKTTPYLPSAAGVYIISKNLFCTKPDMIAFQFLAALAALYLPRQTNKVPHCDHMDPHWVPFLFQGAHFLYLGHRNARKVHAATI